MAEQERADAGIEGRDGMGKALKRRGILAAAGAVVAGIVAKQAAQPVAAGVDGDVVAAGLTVVSAATGLRNNLGGNFVTPTLTCMRGPDNAFPPPGNYGANAALVADSKSSFGSYGVWALGDTGVLAQGVTLGVMGTAGSGIGVQGQSASGNGVFAQSNSGVGIFGASNTSYGVLGASSSAHGVTGVTSGAGFAGLIGQAGANGTTGLVGVVAPGTTGTFAAQFSGPVLVQGSLAVSGAKSAAVPHPDGTHRLLYCVEAPEAWFEDFGEGTLVGGRAEVKLDPGFAAVVDTGELHVFLTEHGDNHNLHVPQRSAGGFTVQASSEALAARGKKASDVTGTFSYRVVARRGDIKAERLAKFAMPTVHGVTVPPIPPIAPEPPKKP